MNADLNNANKTNRRRTVKTRSRFTTLLTVYFFVALIIPNCVLANTEPYSVWTVEALILMPLGFYMMWSVALRRSGVMIWLAFPFIFFCAFQIVLLYLFGNSIHRHGTLFTELADDQSWARRANCWATSIRRWFWSASSTCRCCGSRPARSDTNATSRARRA